MAEKSKKPAIRFAGFTEAWEQRKLGDVAIRESTIVMSSDKNPSIEYEDVVSEEGRLNKDIQLKDMQKNGIAFNGSQVLYGKLRPYLHNWLNPNFSGVAVGDWWVLKPNTINKNFLYRLIQTQKFDDVANQSAGSKMPRADWNLVSNTIFDIPYSVDEQRKIAKTFTNIDNLITLHQRKYDKLVNVKKAMLEKMFPKDGADVPEIRFKGFTEAWEQRKLEGIIQECNVRTSDFRNNPLYSLTIENGVTPKTERYERSSLVIKTEDLFKVVKPNVFVTNPMNLRFGALGYNKNTFNVAVSGYYDVFSIDDNKCSGFWNSYFKTSKSIKIFDDVATGSLIEKRRVKYSTLQQLELYMPKDLDEKIQIGSYMNQIDNLITLHQRKLLNLV